LENVYKFNGKELDTQTGYYYYGARYYDPGASIFLSVDPLAEEFPGWNPYHYVHNNPINLIDPTGMAAEESDDWIKNKSTREYIWDNNVSSPKDTPEGHSYVGKDDNSILKDLGWNLSYPSLNTKKMGRIVLDEHSAGLSTVSATSNIKISVNVSSSFDMETGVYDKTFNGIDIGVSVKGSENVNVTGLATTNFGGEEFTTGLRDVRHNKGTIVTETGTSNINGSILLPASKIYSSRGFNYFPDVNVKGGWINVKSDGSGAVPVSRFGIVPLNYNHTYTPSRPINN